MNYDAMNHTHPHHDLIDEDEKTDAHIAAKQQLFVADAISENPHILQNKFSELGIRNLAVISDRIHYGTIQINQDERDELNKVELLATAVLTLAKLPVKDELGNGEKIPLRDLQEAIRDELIPENLFAATAVPIKDGSELFARVMQTAQLPDGLGSYFKGNSDAASRIVENYLRE